MLLQSKALRKNTHMKRNLVWPRLYGNKTTYYHPNCSESHCILFLEVNYWNT